MSNAFPDDVILDTIGLIQDAALDPTLWARVVDRMARQFHGLAGMLIASDFRRETGFVLGDCGFDPAWMQSYFDHYIHVDPVFDIRSRMVVGRPVSPSTLMPRGAFMKGEFYNDWCTPQGFCNGLGAVVHRQEERQVFLTIVQHRHGDEGSARDMEMFGRLLPHVIRTLRVTERLDILSDRQQALRDALAAVTHAVMLVDRRGRLVLANTPADDMLGSQQALVMNGGRLMARDTATDAALQAALACITLDADAGHGGVKEVAMPREDRRPLLLSIVPVGRRMTDHLDPALRAAAMVIVVDPDVRPWPRLEGFIRVYGLTPAEGRVLDALLDSDALDAVAMRLGIGRATVKTHLNRILAKTGTSRQTQLIRLIAGTVSPLRDRRS